MTSPKFFCFVLMPFADKFNDIYNYGIKESCSEADAYCERVDEQIFLDSIIERVYNQIAKADLVIADMSDKNPNVFYEVGYAHALNKPTILLTNTIEDIPFDLQSYPHIVYDGKISKIRAELPKRIAWFKKNSNANPLTLINPIELYIGQLKLANGKQKVTYRNSSYPNFELKIHNASPFVFESGSFQIGILTDDYEYFSTDRFNEQGETIRLPDYTILHLLPSFDKLLPGVYTSVRITLKNKDSEYPGRANFNVTIRVFTESGSRDFEIELERK